MKEMKYIVKKQMIAGRPYIVIENSNGDLYKAFPIHIVQDKDEPFETIPADIFEEFQFLQCLHCDGCEIEFDL